MKLWKRILLEGLFGLLLLLCIDILPFGFKVVIPLTAVLFLLCLWFRPQEKILAIASLALSLFAINFFMPFFMQETYYRPHEQLGKINQGKFKRYKPNQEIKIERSYGDLAAIAGKSEEFAALKEYRTIRFQTDDLGYRNSSVPKQVDLLLLGDSFTVGTGLDVRDSLAAQLQKHSISVYNLGHNGDIQEYLEAKSWLQSQPNAPKAQKTVMLVFEGNDFEGRNYCVQAGGSLGFIRGIHRQLKELHLSRYLAAVFARLQMNGDQQNESPVEILSLEHGEKLLFMREYIVNASTENYDAQCLESLIKRHPNAVDLVLFIPTKFRTYQALMPKKFAAVPTPSLFSRAFAQIATKMNFAYIDLSPHFVERAKELISKQQFVFWRDDTHWNAHGVEVAKKVILDYWRQQNQSIRTE